MNRKLLAPIAIAAASLLLFSGCAAESGSGDAAKTEVLKVAATTPPMTDVVQAAGKAIEGPYEIEMVEVADYVQPNQMLQTGELTANFVQHPPFMEEFNAKNDASLVAIEPVYLTVVGLYSSKWKSFDEVPEGGSIIIPQDTSNAARALQMLASAKQITLDPKVDKWAVTVDDVTENPKNLKITQIDIMQLVAAYPEADAVFLHNTFATQLDLVPSEDALVTEQDEQFAVSLVSREDNAESPEVKALAKAFHSDEVRKALEQAKVPAAF